jgi:signal transduction histidine kinase
MTAIFAVISTVALITLGLITIVSNPKQKSNRFFFSFCIFLGIWVVANYLADADPVRSLFWTRMAFTSIVGATMFFRLFVTIFPRKVEKLTVKHSYMLAASLLTVFVIWTHYFIPGVRFTNGTSNVVTGSLYPVFIIYFLIFASLSVFILSKQAITLRGMDRARVRLVLLGLISVVALGSLFDLFLPLALGNNQLAAFGTYSTVIFAGLVFVAIVKHKLFDIRLLVARSVAYLLMVASLYAVFGLILLVLSSLFFKDQAVPTGIKVIYLTASVLLAFVFQPLKRIFDKLSNSIFYRDAYDSQVLIDTLNDVLVSTIEIEKLLDNSSRIISEMLKVEFCVFALHAAQAESYKLIGVKGRHLSSQTVNEIKYAAHSVSKKVIVTDEFMDQAPKLKKILQDQRVGALVRLKAIQVGHSQSHVYILVGQKSSGSIYSTQDVSILDILSDELVIAIQNALRFQEIQSFNKTLQQKVEDATKQLRNANHRLKELDQTKDEFISMASHQLRTPLTTIKGYLSMVLDGDVGPVTKDERKMIQQAFDSSERMVFLIGDLLNISRLQSGKFVIENKPTDLAKMVDDQVDQLKETAANHHLTLDFKKPDKFPALSLDETKIQQVVMNFMDNAIFYTPAGGSVSVALEATDHEIRYTVTDTGLGVPKNEQHHLFAKFYRAGNARKMRPDGTGLGLFMAKKVIAAQGGAIIFKSVEGKGSTFGFSFPRAKVEAAK